MRLVNTHADTFIAVESLAGGNVKKCEKVREMYKHSNVNGDALIHTQSGRPNIAANLQREYARVHPLPTEL